MQFIGKHFFRAALFSGALFLFSCATKPVIYNIEDSDKESVYEAEYDKVFASTARTMSGIGFELKARDKEKGFLATDWKEFSVGFDEKSKYSFGVESGGGKVGLEKERARVQALFKIINWYTTKVILIVDIEGRTEVDEPGKWQILYTNGKMEKAVFSNIRAQLKY